MKRYRPLFETHSNELVEWALLEDAGTPFNSKEGLILYEAVINVSVELGNIADLLYDVKNILIPITSIDTFINILNGQFQNKKILFKYNYRLPEDIFTSLNTFNKKTSEIIVYIGPKIHLLNGSNFQELINDLLHLIGHELIHREQFLRMDYIKNIESYAFTDKKKYLSNKQEIMAYAWQIINSFRLHGALDSDIQKILKTNSNIKFQLGGKVLADYHDLFTIDDKELKLLYRYMYLYSEN